MSVELESIRFNHDAATGAFSIRRNEKCPILLPEWRKGMSTRPEDAPAAYAVNLVKDGKVTIEGNFKSTGAKPPKFVRALDGHGHRINVLGTVVPTEVKFVDGEAHLPLVLDGVRIRDAGVGVSDVIWRWQFSDDGENWEDFQTTLHRIYTVIDMPSLPWQPKSKDITNTQLPWTEVLDFACRAAASTTNVDEAAKKITEWTNSLGPGFVRYNNLGNGWTGFTVEEPPRFDCTEFLLLLNGGKNLQGPTVNCDDCAAIVTTFSNILGCRLSEGGMGTGKSFELKEHIRIGLENVSRQSFSRHTVGWLGKCEAEDPLFDGSLRLDLDDDLKSKVFAVAAGLRFSEYVLRLTCDADCKPTGQLPVRTIGLVPPKEEGLESVQPTEDSFITLADVGLLADVLSRAEGSRLFRLIDFRFIRTTIAKYLLQSFWSHQEKKDVAFSVDLYECKSDEEVPEVRDKILFRFNLPILEPIEKPEFGTEAHAPRKNRFVIVFVREKFVFLLRNAGTKPESCEELATLIDALITS